MKIKKIILGVSVCFLSISVCHAQKGTVEGRVDLGYGFTSGSQSVTNESGSTSTDIPYSMGMGANVDLSGSYYFSDFIGAGLDLGYMQGTKTTYTYNAGGLQYTSDLSGTLFALTPFLVLTPHLTGMNPYGRFGIVLGAPTGTISTTAAGNFAPTGTYIDEASGNLALGWYAAFGVQFPLSGNLYLDAELFDRSLQWEPGQVENTQAFDGDPKDKTITYSKKVTSPSADNQVASYSTSYSPLSSVGVKVGITMKFGGM